MRAWSRAVRAKISASSRATITATRKPAATLRRLRVRVGRREPTVDRRPEHSQDRDQLERQALPHRRSAGSSLISQEGSRNGSAPRRTRRFRPLSPPIRPPTLLTEPPSDLARLFGVFPEPGSGGTSANRATDDIPRIRRCKPELGDRVGEAPGDYGLRSAPAMLRPRTPDEDGERRRGRSFARARRGGAATHDHPHGVGTALRQRLPSPR